jgi:hypothetical protein
VNPGKLNGLSKTSQVMVDKPQSIAREKIGAVSGHLDDEPMLAVNRALAVFMGFVLHVRIDVASIHLMNQNGGQNQV